MGCMPFEFLKKKTKSISFPYPENKEEALAFEFSFPPIDEGIPVVSPVSLIKRQYHLVEEIRNTAGLNRSEFERIYLPVIESVAGFLHLLPASRENHHFTTGGLLRHSLEVGHYALRFSNGKIFDGGENTERRRHTTPRWRYATFVAGLCHDLGKPVSDMIITDQSGKSRWNPYDEGLYEWAIRLQVKRYYLNWSDIRIHKEHERFNNLVLNRVLPKEGYAYISEYGINIMSDLLAAVSGAMSNLVSEMMHQADRESVSRNLEGSLDLMQIRKRPKPIESHLIDAIRHLSTNKWAINIPGARVWVSDESVFLLWSLACVDVRNYLAGCGVSGIPADPDVLAKLLIERGLAVPNEDEHGRLNVYWQVKPSIKGTNDAQLEVLRIDRIDLIFDDLPPRKHKVKLVGVDEEEDDLTVSEMDDSEPTMTIEEPEKVTNRTISEENEELVTPQIQEEQEKSDAENESRASYTEEQIEEVDEVEPTLSPALIGAYEVLEQDPKLGVLLRAIAEDIRDGKLKRNEEYLLDEKYFCIAHPKVINKYGFDANQILAELDKKMMLVIDPMKPNLKIQSMKVGKNEFRGFVLHKKISDAVRLIIESKIQREISEEDPSSNHEKRTLEEILKLIESDSKILFRDEEDDSVVYVNHNHLFGWYMKNNESNNVNNLTNIIKSSERTIPAMGKKRGNLHKINGQEYFKFKWPRKNS